MSELARDVTREAILNYAKDHVKPHTAAVNTVHRARSDVDYATRVLESACNRSDEFERVSVELMLAERDGDILDMPWNQKLLGR